MAVATPTRRKGRDVRLRLADMRASSAYDLIMGLDLTGIADEVRASSELEDDLLSMALGEFRRFLVLRLAGFVGLACPRTIGVIWHRLILDTGRYSLFCDQTFGSFFHHTHVAPWVLHDSRAMLEEAYYHVFGILPPNEVWGGQLTCLAMSGGTIRFGTTETNPPNPPLPPTR